MGADKAIEYTYDHTRLLSITYPSYPDANVTYEYGTDADRTHNQAGRIKRVTHQSGTEVREYGTLGETVRETLTLTAAANGGSTPPVYTTQYSFDSFGRLHTVTMPDNEVITHRYDSGGNLASIDGRLNGHPYTYLERLDYDKFEQRVYMKAGNGVVTKYAYRPDNRRLETLKAGLPGKDWMQDMTYGYDNVGNITSLIDSAPIPKSNVYGGQSTQTFEYDDLYRLVKADGVYTTAREEQTYALAMAYDTIHNITHKNQLHTVGKVGGTSPKTETATTYDWGYTYRDNNHTQPHAPTHIGERTFEYDANGNQHGWKSDANGSRRTIVWDDENRIREVQDPKHGAAFTYDDKGERKLRKSQYGETAYINQYFSVRNGAIASTHVYAGTSRIVTKVGAGTPVGKVTTTIQGTGNITDTGPTMGDVIIITADGTTTTGSAPTPATTTATTPSPSASAEEGTATGHPGQGLEHRSDRANEVARNTQKNKHLNGGTPGGEHGSANSNKGGHGNAAGTSNNPGANTGTGGGDTGGGSGTGGNTGGSTGGGTGTGDGMEFIYFYHPDHLGSTGYVTDEKAQRYEHITYFPFGETWVQEATATWRVPYQFTSKEMDPETGLYYFGARYYDPRTSVWQSADPALPKYLSRPQGFGASSVGVFDSVNLALYSYSRVNPVRFKDPDGEEWVFAFDQSARPRDRGVAGETYTGNYYVFSLSHGVKGPYAGSIHPNSASPSNNASAYQYVKAKGLSQGGIPFVNKYGHTSGTKQGLNLGQFTSNGGNRTFSRVVEAEGPNPAQKGDAIMENINIHSGKSDLGGFRSRGSEGCGTICPKESDQFMANFEWNKEGNTNTGTSEGRIFMYKGESAERTVVEKLVDFFANKEPIKE